MWSECGYDEVLFGSPGTVRGPSGCSRDPSEPQCRSYSSSRDARGQPHESALLPCHRAPESRWLSEVDCLAHERDRRSRRTECRARGSQRESPDSHRDPHGSSLDAALRPSLTRGLFPDAPGSDRDATRSDRDARGSDRDARGSDRDVSASHRAAAGSDRDADGGQRDRGLRSRRPCLRPADVCGRERRGERPSCPHGGSSEWAATSSRPHGGPELLPCVRYRRGGGGSCRHRGIPQEAGVFPPGW
jgi:hypothetical protein